MSRIVVDGVGAVSPAGWRAGDLIRAVHAGVPLPATALSRPGQPPGFDVRRVPGQPAPEPWQRHPRLRRVSPISRYAVAAAIEAVGAEAPRVAAGELRLGIVYCVMAGCVNYSSRFYQEVLEEPATASPLVFPETVFNAPASHLAALLGTEAINYTHVGDDTAFVSGLVTAAGWLDEGRVDRCLVIGAEEADWLTAGAMSLFDRSNVLAEGAGAICLRRAEHGIALDCVTNQFAYATPAARDQAPARVRAELEARTRAQQLVPSMHRMAGPRCPEADAWQNWAGERVLPRAVVGNAFNAASAWQVIVATEALRAGAMIRAFVPVTGCNQAAMGLGLARV